MTPRTRLALVAAALVVLVAGFVIAQSAGDDDNGTTTTTTTVATSPTTTAATTETTAPATTTPAPQPTTIVVRDGKPAGGVAKLDVQKGDQVRFTVRSDVADEIHVHGYDLMKDVPAGGSVSFSFKATIDGKFEIELEDAGEQIASLTVEP